MRRFIVISSLVVAFAAVTYSVIHTTAADRSSVPWMSAVAVAGVVLLVALRLLTIDSIRKGNVASIYSLIPGIIEWSTNSWPRALCFSVIALCFSYATIRVGPGSLHRINVQTGSAHYIQLEENGKLLQATGWYSQEVWHPGVSFDSVVGKVKCLTKDYLPWTPVVSNRVSVCGEPLEPTLITNGIGISDVDTGTIQGRRIVKGVKALRKHFKDDLFPERNVKDNLLLATWNIRNFDDNRFGYGYRLDESYYYIAEIISHFDILAVQEVGPDTAPLKRIQNLLGESWDVVYSLVSPGRRGNNERMAFFFDRRKVRLGPIISSVTLPEVRHVNTTEDNHESVDVEQLSRIPYLVTFVIADRRFSICSIHIYFGSHSGMRLQRRIEEIRRLADYLDYISKNDPALRGDLFLVGTLNASTTDSPEIVALRDAGFYIDPELGNLPTNYNKSRVYDQIAVLRNNSDRFRIGQVGVFDFSIDVFKEIDELQYRADMGERYLTPPDGEILTTNLQTKYFNKWKTFQMSDHFPKWVELRIPQ